MDTLFDSFWVNSNVICTFPSIHKKLVLGMAPVARPLPPEPSRDWMRHKLEWRQSRCKACGPSHSLQCDQQEAESAETDGAGCLTGTPSCAPPCGYKTSHYNVLKRRGTMQKVTEIVLMT